jgi:DNA-binding NarL/FixJ family response regulator
LELIKDGKKVNEISEILCISRFTAENHQNNMLRKLGYHNNAQLVDYYHKHVAQGVE